MTIKNTPPSILIIIDTLHQGGLAKVQLDLAKAWLNKGYRVGLISLDSQIDYPLPDFQYFSQHLEKPIRFRWQAIAKRQKMTAWIKNQISIFESKVGTANLIVAAGELALRTASAIEHPALVLSSHSSQLQAAKSKGIKGQIRLFIKKTRRGWRLQKLLNQKRLHVVSHGLAYEMTQILGVQPSQLSQIYNPFDFDEIRMQGSLLTEQAAQMTQPYIIGVGNLTLHKGFHKLLQAFAQSNYSGDLVLVGRGPEEEKLRQLAKEFKIQHRVHFLPFHNNHYSLVKRAQLLVLTSEGEGLGNVLIEALILGVPVLSTDCPYGPREIIEPFDADALVGLNDIENLSKKISQLSNQPYLIPESLLSRFDQKTILHQYDQLLN